MGIYSGMRVREVGGTDSTAVAGACAMPVPITGVRQGLSVRCTSQADMCQARIKLGNTPDKVITVFGCLHSCCHLKATFLFQDSFSFSGPCL